MTPTNEPVVRKPAIAYRRGDAPTDIKAVTVYPWVASDELDSAPSLQVFAIRAEITLRKQKNGRAILRRGLDRLPAVRFRARGRGGGLRHPALANRLKTRTLRKSPGKARGDTVARGGRTAGGIDGMPRHDADAPVSEPLIVPDLFITAARIERNSHVLRFVGMVRIPRVDDGELEELRIVVRLSMPVDAVRGLRRALIRAMSEGEEREN
jgi:hypothetical protein